MKQKKKKGFTETKTQKQGEEILEPQFTNINQSLSNVERYHFQDYVTSDRKELGKLINGLEKVDDKVILLSSEDCVNWESGMEIASSASVPNIIVDKDGNGI